MNAVFLATVFMLRRSDVDGNLGPGTTDCRSGEFQYGEGEKMSEKSWGHEDVKIGTRMNVI